MHKTILETWERDGPQMTARLKKLKVMDDLAVVCQQRMWQTNELYQAAKMPPTGAREQGSKGAREQAMKEHLMLESRRVVVLKLLAATVALAIDLLINDPLELVGSLYQ